MANAKLLSFVPALSNGAHKSFESKYGTMYVFKVELEGDIKGECNSTKKEPSWKVGEEYEVTVTPKDNYPDGIKIKTVGGPGGGFKKGGGGGYSSETPEEKERRQRLIVAQSSADRAVDIVKEKVDIAKVKEIADEIFDYVIAKGESKTPPTDEQFKSMLNYSEKKDLKVRVATLKALCKYSLSDDMFTEIAKATLE